MKHLYPLHKRRIQFWCSAAFLAAWLLYVAQPTQAQSYFGIGVHGIPQATSLPGFLDQYEDVPDDRQPTNILTIRGAGGVHLTYMYKGTIGLMTGATLSYQGQKFDIKDNSFGLFKEAFLDIRTLKVPILLKLNANPGNKAMFTVYAGPQFNLVQRATQTFDTFEVKLNNKGLKEQLKPSVLDIAFGLGTDIWLSKSVQLNMHLRGDYSLSAIGKEAESTTGASTEEAPDIRNLTLGLLVGFTFCFTGGGSNQKPYQGRHTNRLGG